MLHVDINPHQVELYEAETMKKESVPGLHIPSFLENEVGLHHYIEALGA